MPDKVRIGIIGAGNIFRQRHFPGLAKIDGAEIAVICNRSEESARGIAAEFGLSPEVMTDPHALMGARRSRRDHDRHLALQALSIRS